MHDQFCEILLAVVRQFGGNLRLVAALTDDCFGYPDPNAIQIFIPDLHLLSAARRALYQYGTNHEDMLTALVQALIAFRTGAAANQSVVIFHIGDYLDLWRQSANPAGDPNVPVAIKADHGPLVQALEDPRLNTHFLLGNHDFDLYELQSYNAWERRFFIPGDAPGTIVMHGDYFDWLERNVPQGIRDIAVYLFAEGHQPGVAILTKMAGLARACNAEKDFSQCIQLMQPAPLGVPQPGDAAVGAQFNVQTAANTVAGGTLFLDKACQECVNANTQNETGMRAVFIGHTHHARIATQAMPDGFTFALVDTGAWIEKCSNADGSMLFPNAQITALSGNQVRIYQLDREVG